MLSKLKRSTLLNTLMGVMFISTFFILGHSAGMTGRTKKSGTDGCSCHGSQSAAVTVLIEGPATLGPGKTGDYTITISGGPLVKAGTDIAASAGTLGKVDNSLQLTAPKSPANSKVTFAFKYTAPATTGQVTLFANGNSVNNSGSSAGDQWNFATNKIVDVTTVGVGQDNADIISFQLEQNYPNPFNPATKIKFTVPSQGNYTLNVFNLSGEEIATLLNKEISPGAHEVVFNAAQIPSGVYLYKLTGNGYSVSKKMVLTK
ncbi:MAG: T9SS type A sorting domain-containing protein [Ignavibacteriales bacterium]|nr:T9SS type A sorting domain-containing protein [Ignavibacteriales bacterium]